MAYQTVTVVPSGARTTTGTSAAVLGADTGDVLSLQVNVSAASGTTPTLLLSVEWSIDGTNWATLDGAAETFTSITTTANRIKTFPVKAPNYRVVWTIGGTTPSFTFSVLGYTTT